jgi:hypothetical protein
MNKTIILSDGQPCIIRQLGLFETDGVGRELLGMYTYSILLATGRVVEVEYNLRALDFTPTPANVPKSELKPNTPEWEQQDEYDTYFAALAHEQKRIESYEGYINDIAAYILANCVEPQDRTRIVTPDDWQAIQAAALVPQLDAEGLARCLRQTFQSVIQEL